MADVTAPRTRRVVVVDNSALAKAVGDRIRERRERARLTQQQLAGDRYTAAYISALERGLAKPSLASMAYLAPRLGVRIAELIDGDVASAVEALEAVVRWYEDENFTLAQQEAAFDLALAAVQQFRPVPQAVGVANA